MNSNYKRQVFVQQEPKLEDNHKYEDDIDSIKKQKSFFQKIYFSKKQLKNLFNLIIFEKIGVGLIILYLLAPTIQVCLLFYFLTICKELILSMFCCVSYFFCIFQKYKMFPSVYLENENKVIKFILVMFDLECLYIMKKIPNSLVDLLNYRNKILLNYSQLCFNLVMCHCTLFDEYSQVPFFPQIYFSLVSIAMIIKNYSEMYPHSNNQTLQSWLCNRKFANSLLHGCTFYQLLIIFFKSIRMFDYLPMALQLITVTLRFRPINISPFYFHFIIDIPFSQENITKSQLLKQGYEPLTEAILVCIIQKSVIIYIMISGVFKSSYLRYFSTFYLTLGLLFLSIISLLILIKRYIKQYKLLYGQCPQLIEVKSEEELQKLINEDTIQIRFKYSNLQVINITSENIKKKDAIHLLFYCFKSSDIYFKNSFYSRKTSNFNKSYKIVNIQNINELHNLDFNQNKQAILDNICSIATYHKQQQTNEDIYKKLVENDIIVQIKDEQLNQDLPSFQTYKKYTGEILSIKAQILAFHSTIGKLLSNNSLQVYYDLYD